VRRRRRRRIRKALRMRIRLVEYAYVGPRERCEGGYLCWAGIASGDRWGRGRERDVSGVLQDLRGGRSDGRRALAREKFGSGGGLGGWLGGSVWVVNIGIIKRRSSLRVYNPLLSALLLLEEGLLLC
jgi:hypothetical protein